MQYIKCFFSIFILVNVTAYGSALLRINNDIATRDVVEPVSVTHPKFVTNSEHPDLPLATYQLVSDFQSVMDHYSIPFFFSSGTLLGAVRHGGMIPHDDDADCCLLGEYVEQFVRRALPLLNKLGYGATPTNKGWRGLQIKKEGRAFIDSAQLDVFIMERDRKGVYVYPTGWPWMKLTAYQIFPIRKIQFGPVLINAPNDTKDFLDQNFGEMWGTHKKIYNHTTLVGTTSFLEPLGSEDFLPAGPFAPLHENSREIKEFSESCVSGLGFHDEIISHMHTIPAALPSEVPYGNGFVMTYGYSWAEKTGERFLSNVVEFLFTPPVSESDRFKVKLIGSKFYSTAEDSLSLLDNGANISVQHETEGFSFIVNGKHEHNLTLTMNWWGRPCDRAKSRSSDARRISFLLREVKIASYH